MPNNTFSDHSVTYAPCSKKLILPCFKILYRCVYMQKYKTAGDVTRVPGTVGEGERMILRDREKGDCNFIYSSFFFL